MLIKLSIWDKNMSWLELKKPSIEKNDTIIRIKKKPSIEKNDTIIKYENG